MSSEPAGAGAGPAGVPVAAGACAEVAVRLAATGRLVAESLRRQLAPVGLDPRQYRVLAAVAIAGGCPQRALTTRLGIPPSRVVGILDALQERALVERWEAPGDRRAHAVRVTAAGAALLEQARPLVENHGASIVAGLRGPDVRVLERLRDRVAANCGGCC
ncbi:MAG: MarR family winged helix-turn-helix transcriptional regulator [Acidimicrobiales bacterium]